MSSFQQDKLCLYTLDMKYVRALSKVDDHVMSVSPQIDKENRPFVGIVVICDSKQYCIPLSSPKAKHKTMNNDVDFIKIFESDKLIGVLNLNNMIPVDIRFVQILNLKSNSKDDPSIKYYKKLAFKQLQYCRKNHESIISKANKLYDMIITGNCNESLKKRCCDFVKLEAVLARELVKGEEGMNIDYFKISVVP